MFAEYPERNSGEVQVRLACLIYGALHIADHEDPSIA